MPIFTAGVFLLSGLAIAVPIALHLLRRRQPQPILFGAVRFMRDALAKSRRSRRLTQGLTLLLRCLTLLLLAVGFSQPQVPNASFLPAGSRRLLLVLDASATMQAVAGEQSLFERSRRWCGELLDGLEAGDAAGLLVADDAGEGAVLLPVTDVETLRPLLQEASCGFGAVDVPARVLALLRGDGAGLERFELHLFSDFQRGSWPEGSVAELQSELRRRGATVFLNGAAASGLLSDAGVVKVTLTPEALVGGGPYSCAYELCHTPNYAGSLTVRLEGGGREQDQLTAVLPGAELSERLTGQADLADGGEFTGRVVIDGDSYALNDSRHYSLARLGNRRALVVNGSGDERDGFFLTRALRPAGVAFSYVMPETKDWAGLMNTSDLSPYAMVLVCNPPEMPSAVVSSLRRYVESGGQLVLFPGGQGGLKAEALRELCGLGAEGLSVSDTGMLEERPLRVTTEASWGELPSRLSRMASPPWPLVVRRRLVLKAGETGAFLRFEGTDGGEFMLRRALGAGEVLVCAVSANRDWSDLPLTPFYFVLMQELSRHGAGYRHRPLETVVGGELALACRGDISSVTALKGQEPSGRTVELPCAAAARGGLLVVRGFRTPGIFRVELPGGESRQVAVNLPDSESRLELWPPESLTGTLFTEVPSFWSADESELRRQSSQASRMRPLSPWLLLAAFALSMAEVLYANVRSRRQGQPRLLGRLLREGGGVA